MTELQQQMDSLNDRMVQAERKTNQTAHFGKHKIKELITEVDNLQSIVVKYKNRETKLKKKLNDEVTGGKKSIGKLAKKRMSQTIQKSVN